MPRTVPIHQSLHRHNLVMGGERDLVMVSALFSLLLAIGGLTWIATITAVFLWMSTIFSLRFMAKADPLMSKVWMRHSKQQLVYAARSSRWRMLGGFTC